MIVVPKSGSHVVLLLAVCWLHLNGTLFNDSGLGMPESFYSLPESLWWQNAL